MRTVTTDFKNKIPLLGKQNDMYISYDAVQVKPERMKYSFAGNVFKTSLSQLEVDVKNGTNLVGKTIEAKFGLLVSGAYEYITWSNMYVYKSQTDADKKLVKSYAYDRMIEFMVRYDITSTATNLLDYVKDICTRIGITLYSETFFNSDLPIGEDYFVTQSLTFRDVLDQIAEVTFCNILIKDNKLWLRAVDEMKATPEVLSNKVIKQGTVNAYWGDVNSFVLGRAPQKGNDVFEKDEEGIEENGLHELRFDNNQFVNLIREDVILDMFNKIKGIGYYPTSTKTLGLGYLEFGDWVSVPDFDASNYYISLVTKYEFTITTGTTDLITSIVPSTTTTEYTYATADQKRITNTEIVVNQQENTITSLAEQLEFYDSAENIGEVHLVDSMESHLIYTSINGNVGYTYPSDNSYPADDEYPIVSCTMVADNQPKGSMSEDAVQIEIDLSSGPLLTYDATHYDYIFFDYDGHLKIYRVCEMNEDESISLLAEPITEDLGEIEQIPTFNGNTYIYLLEFDDIYIYTEYLRSTDISTVFASKSQLYSKILQTSTSILLEVANKVGTNEIISRINQTAEEIKIQASKISLEGLVTANEYFKILLDGSIEARNGKFYGDIYLPEGGKVIGGDGILTNLQFKSNDNYGEYSFVGCNPIFGDDTMYWRMVIHATIPENFTIVSAKITYVNIPFCWFNSDSTSHWWGYVRNLKAFKQTSNNMYLIGGYYSEYNGEENATYEELTSAFGSGYTPSAPSDVSQVVETTVSGDIKSSLSVGKNIIILRPNTKPSTTGDYDLDIANCAPITSAGFAVLDIIGYYSLNE